MTFVFSYEAVKKLRFSGAMTKYRTLDYVLDMISKTTDVTFSLKENRVTVSSKKWTHVTTNKKSRIVVTHDPR